MTLDALRLSPFKGFHFSGRQAVNGAIQKLAFDPLFVIFPPGYSQPGSPRHVGCSQ
jgi:hypothetical protein